MTLWLQDKFVRFLFVGAVNTGVAYGIYALFLFLGFHYAVANLLSLLLSLVFSFKTQGRWVFGNVDPRRFGRFVACWLVIYLGNVALIKALLSLGANAYVAGAIAIGPVAGLSYVVQKYVVFGPGAGSSP